VQTDISAIYNFVTLCCVGLSITHEKNSSELSNYVSVLREWIIFWSSVLKWKHNGLILKSVACMLQTANITITNFAEL